MDDYLNPIKKLSKENQTFCIVSSYERGKEKKIIYNSSFLINDIGEIQGVYRKTHLFPTERINKGGWTTKGNDIPVFDTKLGKIGIIICYDGDFPELTRILALKGAEIIARPSALLRNYEIWEMENRLRAYENDVFFISPNAIGVDAKNINFFGHSMIVSPTADKLAVARANEEIIFSKLSKDKKTLENGIHSEFTVVFDHLSDRNTESYKKYDDLLF